MQKEEFAQRKYYNFPRTNHTVDFKQDEIASVKQELQPVTPAMVQPEEKQLGSAPLSASANQNEIQPLKAKLPAVKINSHLALNVENPTSDVPVISKKNSDALAFSKNKAFNPLLRKGGDFILQIFAAILLPPVGIYLHDNGRTGAWFWVSMILCLGAIAGFAVGGLGVYGFIGPICWAAAAIVALLVVFDVL